MRTKPFPINVANPEFPAIATGSTSPDSEGVAIINFKKPDGEKLCTAVLLPPSADTPLQYEVDMAIYPILFPDGTVDIRFGYHVDTVNNRHTMLAFITTTAIDGSTFTRVHGL